MAGKKVVRNKKKVSKNVVAGAAHAGLLPVKWASAEAARAPRSQHRWQQKPLPKLQWNMA